MNAVKLSAKAIAVLVEFIFLLAFFFFYLIVLLILQPIYSAIDNTRYYEKNKNIPNSFSHDKERRQLKDEKIEQDYIRKKTLLDRLANYWIKPFQWVMN